MTSLATSVEGEVGSGVVFPPGMPPPPSSFRFSRLFLSPSDITFLRDFVEKEYPRMVLDPLNPSKSFRWSLRSFIELRNELDHIEKTLNELIRRGKVCSPVESDKYARILASCSDCLTRGRKCVSVLKDEAGVRFVREKWLRMERKKRWRRKRKMRLQQQRRDFRERRRILDEEVDRWQIEELSVDVEKEMMLAITQLMKSESQAEECVRSRLRLAEELVRLKLLREERDSQEQGEQKRRKRAISSPFRSGFEDVRRNTSSSLYELLEEDVREKRRGHESSYELFDEFLGWTKGSEKVVCGTMEAVDRERESGSIAKSVDELISRRDGWDLWISKERPEAGKPVVQARLPASVIPPCFAPSPRWKRFSVLSGEKKLT